MKRTPKKRATKKVLRKRWPYYWSFRICFLSSGTDREM